MSGNAWNFLKFFSGQSENSEVSKIRLLWPKGKNAFPLFWIYRTRYLTVIVRKKPESSPGPALYFG